MKYTKYMTYTTYTMYMTYMKYAIGRESSHERLASTPPRAMGNPAAAALGFLSSRSGASAPCSAPHSGRLRSFALWISSVSDCRRCCPRVALAHPRSECLYFVSSSSLGRLGEEGNILAYSLRPAPQLLFP